MSAINAIAKVRFSSARPQRVHLEDKGGVVSELLCMESGQTVAIDDPSTKLYVILGTASILVDGEKILLETGCLITPAASFELANAGEHRLVCLAFSLAS